MMMQKILVSLTSLRPNVTQVQNCPVVSVWTKVQSHNTAVTVHSKSVNLGKQRPVVDKLCYPNWSPFRKSKGCWKMVFAFEKDRVKQATFVWSRLAIFICQCNHGLLFKKCYFQNDSTFYKAFV